MISLAISICLWIVCVGILLPEAVLAYQTENVVLVIIDGLRYSEGLGDPNHTYVPRMYALSQEGTIIEPFTNDGYTYTSRAIPAIWCGAWTEVYTFSDPDCGGRQNNYTELPTVFEYYRKQLERPSDDCIYVLKDVGCPWKASFTEAYGPDYWPLYHSFGVTDLDVWHEAQQILSIQHPSFFLLYLAEVDGAGHSGDWSYYTSAIATADSIVGMLWDFLESDPFYAGKTTMFVTNDHGRHTYDFTGHGDGCEGCRTIQLLAIGPDIKRNFVSTTPRTLRDITPTIGELLGFIAEEATGTVMTEILEDSAIVDGNAKRLVYLEVAPNPFASWTRLRFSAEQATFGEIRIYDVQGRLVAVPFSGEITPTGYDLVWRSYDLRGNRLSPGTYFASLRTQFTSTTRRLVILKKGK